MPPRVGLLLLCLSTACAPPRGTIGAVLGQRNDGTLVVREAPKGLAAERAGVRAGDEVLLINGRDVRSMKPEALHRILGGEVGERVKLTLVRGERVLRLTLLRSPAPRGPSASTRAPAD